MKKYLIIFFVITLNLIFSQEINNVGMPYIEKFKYENEKNFSHIWQIDEAPNHVMYFVNDNGLMQYDGKNWELFKGNKAIHRSLLVYNNETIYTGLDNDFGVWKKNANQQFEYKSLYPYLNKNNKMVEEFWHVYKIEKFIIFHSFTNIYVYDFKNIVKISGQFKKSFQHEDFIYFTDNYGKVSVFDGVNLVEYEQSELVKDFKIINKFTLKGKTIIVSKEKGFYEFSNNTLRDLSPTLNSQITKDIIFSTAKINKNYIAIGTVLNGIYIIDDKGNIIHRINKLKGLQNNTILSMYYSKYGKLWLGLDFGIDALNINSNYSFIVDYEGKIGSSYCALLENEKLYIGSNQGLYSINYNGLLNHLNSYNFELIPNSQGQVWTMNKINNKIYLGHDKGLYEINNNQIKNIDTRKGVWSIANWKNTHLITGNYSGVHIYQNINNSLVYLKSLPNETGSCNKILIYQDYLIIRLSNYGILQLKLNKNLEIVSKELYKADLFENSKFNIEIKNNELIVNTLNYIYSKKITDKSFVRKENITDIFLKNELLPENFIASSLNSQYNFYPIYSGFAIKNNAIKNNIIPINKVFISKAYFYNERENISIKNEEELHYKNNNLKFEFIVPNYPHEVKYQYKLLGLEEEWSEWSSKNKLDFINLKSGDYELEIKARVGDSISEVTVFKFEVDTPFYKSFLAYLIYFLILLYIIYVTRFYHHKKLNYQKLKLLKTQKETLNEQTRKYQEKLLIEQQEKLVLEQKQLKLTLENKELELAKKIIDQKEINDLILGIRKKIEESQNNANQRMSPKNYQEILNFLDKKVNKELDKEYEIAFDSSQTSFHDNLLKTHPNLTPKDLRIASYLTMNLSSKEIAKLLQVLPSSIDVNRSRLRKKLEIEDSVNLRDYLNKYI